jgi:hypothetical protein
MKKIVRETGLVVIANNLSTKEAKGGGLRVQGQPDLIDRSCLKETSTTTDG